MLCFQLYPRPSRLRDARCSGGKMTWYTRGPKFLFKPDLIHMHPWNISFESLDWSLTNFFHPSFATTQPRPQGAFPWLSGKSALGTKLNPTLILIEMLIWNEKDNVKFGDFPVQGQSFRFRKLCQVPKQTTSSLDRSAVGCEVSLEPFIPAVRTFCKPYSYKWFLSRLM